MDSRDLEQRRGLRGYNADSRSSLDAPLTVTETMLVNLRTLIDEPKCYEILRQLRWPEGVTCPDCESNQVVKRGFDETEPLRQRYQCKACSTRFDDLSDTINACHHQPLHTWIGCLYLMGLNLSLPADWAGTEPE